jgi:uncharacterized NAD-dependent epimerase/dehydratase family protein
MRGVPGRALPGLKETLERNIEAARLTSPNVRAVGICLNTSRLDRARAQVLCRETEDRLGLPCTDPMAFGVGAIIDELLCVERSASATTVSL